MGYLISITASSRKQAEKTLSELTGVLKKQGKKVSKVRVATNLAPPNTKSPYISSSFDINARYSHLPSIAEKLKNNDIVFIIGSMAETVIREADKFKTKDELIRRILELPSEKRRSKNSIAKGLGYAGATSLNNLINISVISKGPVFSFFLN